MKLVNVYPCCEQPTGAPMTNGWVHPDWHVPRHICFAAWGWCSVCREDDICELWDQSTWVCSQCAV